MILTKAGSILGPIATVLGYIMDILFRFTDIFGIFNVGLCIILFTIVMKTLMIPLTIKQQKTTKLMSVMNPEIQAIQKKDKGKTDNESLQRQNVEVQAVYEKYGTSMTGGCLPLLIQMPILLALYRVIYNAIEDVESAMKGMLEPVFEEKVLGHAEVRQTFKASGVGTIAGSYVLDGVFERDCSVRLTRDGIVIFEGPLASLKRFKDDVKEVKAGYECGFVFANFNDIKEGDLVEAFKMVEIPR